MRIAERILVNAPPEAVWAVISDPESYLHFMSGITRWEVKDGKARGLGARYSMRMRAGSAEIGGLIEVVEFDEPADMAWTSITGLDQRGRWRLRPRERGRTLVELRISYKAPGGVLALISDQLGAPIVRRNVRLSLHALKRRVEAERMRQSRAGRRKRAATR